MTALLADKVAVVVGGGGLGEATAHALARGQATVVVADILGEEAERVAAELRSAGQRRSPARSTSPTRPALRPSFPGASMNSDVLTWPRTSLESSGLLPTP
jgi:NAD(P)-dependent dehydrogenase (short-subunit alcohol dehydrogenase family)